MTSNIVKNRIVVALARECLQSNGFANVGVNRENGTFPDVYATALDTTNGVDYLIGITGRAENKENGDWDPLFNLVRTDRPRKGEITGGSDEQKASVCGDCLTQVGQQLRCVFRGA
jgi:hypothetical protein